ncbi:MAG: hypothetical protein U5K79_21235 [Cyclobacteriaceae bacterium]|nr:hypothetical protein [Cyclobacteriaceae bacterium]
MKNMSMVRLPVPERRTRTTVSTNIRAFKIPVNLGHIPADCSNSSKTIAYETHIFLLIYLSVVSVGMETTRATIPGDGNHGRRGN